MSDWKECSDGEREIILAIHKKPKFISEISSELNKSIQIVGKTIERMLTQDLVEKTHQYGKDARKSKISINYRRVKIEKTHKFYLIYFILTSIPFIISLILSIILKEYFLIVGCGVGILPSVLFMIYQVYIKGDKIIVEKNPKKKKQNEKLESEQVDNVD